MQVTEAVRGSRDIDEAAQIWAEATAARDGSQDVAGLGVSRPLIEALLDRSADAFVLVATSGDGTVVGFAAVRRPRRRGGRRSAIWACGRAAGATVWAS